MKIIGISGSPRKENTYYMVKTVLEATGHDYELILLCEKDIKPCLDCRNCHKTHKRFTQDDMQKIYQKLVSANAIVLGSPTYFDNVSGLMKNFMDRCLPFCHYFSSELKDKPVALVAVGNFEEYLEFDDQGNSKWDKEEKESVNRCLNAMENFSTHIGLNTIGKVYATQSNPKAK